MKHLKKFDNLNEGLFSKKDDPFIKSLISSIESTFDIDNLKQRPGIDGSTDFQYTMDNKVITLTTHSEWESSCDLEEEDEEINIITMDINGKSLNCKGKYVVKLYEFFIDAVESANFKPRPQPNWEPIKKTPNAPDPAVKPERVNTKDPVKSHSDYQAYDNFKYKK